MSPADYRIVKKNNADLTIGKMPIKQYICHADGHSAVVEYQPALWEGWQIRWITYMENEPTAERSHASAEHWQGKNRYLDVSDAERESATKHAAMHYTPSLNPWRPEDEKL